MPDSAPTSWTELSLGELVKRLVNGGTPPTSIAAYWEGGTPWITGADFTRSGLSEFRRFVSDEAVRQTATNVIAKGELLLVTRTGVGKLAIAPCDVAISQDITGVYPDRQLVDVEFFYHRMRQGVDDLKKLNQGTSINGIVRNDLVSYRIALPPLTQQQRIAEILSTVDEAIEQTEALIAKTQQIKAGLMHDLFTRGVTTDGQLRPPREQAAQIYKESPLGWIPKEWEVNTALECASNTPSSTTIGPFGSNLVAADYRESGVPVVFVRDVKVDRFEWNSAVYITDEKALSLAAHGVRAGDIVATKMGLPPCVACRYPDWMPHGIVTADIIRLRPDVTTVDTRWLSAALNSESTRRQVLAITAGVTRPKVTLADFRKLRLPYPPRTEQDAIGERLAAVDDSVDVENQRLRKLILIRYGLMHDLLTGRVPVLATSNANVTELAANV